MSPAYEHLQVSGGGPEILENTSLNNSQLLGGVDCFPYGHLIGQLSFLALPLLSVSVIAGGSWLTLMKWRRIP